MNETLAVIGLGYVGLPLAVALAKRFPVIGFDINARRVAELNEDNDRTGEVSRADLAACSASFTADPAALETATVYFLTVPTPITANRQPDLSLLEKACELIGPWLKPGDLVTLESTVYPGVTENYCGPILERVSGLKLYRDIRLAYSPERINPGDREHTIERIVKVVAGQDAETLERIAGIYEAIVQPGVFRAASIQVAEAAKVIENTQRDLNIALMNELSIIFERLDIRTADVLAAAGTKWNFLPFRPGLVGGHCIGVDPYYLTARAEDVGYHPEVILSGRRINDQMGVYIAQRAMKMLARRRRLDIATHVAVLGVTFKEDVTDLRNSRVPDIVRELTEFGLTVKLHDPVADAGETMHEYGCRLCDEPELDGADCIILAVSHREYVRRGAAWINEIAGPSAVVVDVKSVLDRNALRKDLDYWSL
ncbi:MAG: nucleotide sugar dehydrogenase [Pseudomonadota bacterium]|nr:nucleotide sugar dehydrogenase [Pseudomonadota bacterium]